MKRLQKILSLVLASSLLLLAACSKKPVRDANAGTSMGATVDPNAIAVQPDSVAPGTGLEARNLPPGVTEDEFTIRGLLEAVYFDFDRSATGPSEKPKIEAAAKWLKENADKRMLLEGHCDWRGTAEYNLGLGDRRANAVKRYLETMGIDPKRLEILSKGSVDSKQGGTEADWKKDRRVDFVILKK